MDVSNLRQKGCVLPNMEGIGAQEGKEGTNPLVQRKSQRVIPERLNFAQFPTYWTVNAELVN